MKTLKQQIKSQNKKRDEVLSYDQDSILSVQDAVLSPDQDLIPPDQNILLSQDQDTPNQNTLLSPDQDLIPPQQNTSFLDYYNSRRNYDEFASNSLSKAKKLYEEFYKRYKYLENLGYKAPKPPLLSVFDFLNEEKIKSHEKEIEDLKQNLPENIKTQVLTLDEIKEEIKLNSKNAENLLKELEKSTSFVKKNLCRCCSEYYKCNK